MIKFRKFIRNVIVTAIFLCFTMIMTASAHAGLADWQLPEDLSPIQVELENVPLNADFYFMSEKIEYTKSPYISTGRIYLPLYETVSAMGGEVKESGYGYDIKINVNEFYIDKQNDNSYPKRIIKIGETDYVSMFLLLNNTSYQPVFNTNINRVDIFYSQNNIAYNYKTDENKGAAYLRLEDIMADGKDTGGFYDDIGLEKLRTISDYLNKNNQAFYIAWIPVYKNPANNFENYLTKNFNLYNSSFLYTLDYLVKNGGKIGMHGYTHQYNNDKSADGYEFGAKTPFSDVECINRMLEAKKVARDLGYKVTFFEFPHYAATSDQLRYAEKYFDAIYQQDWSVITKGYIAEWTRSSGKKVKYVPTPADYVYNKYDIDGINSRIDDSIKKGMIVSLFYHPRIDFDAIGMKTENNIRACTIAEDSIIYKVVNKVLSKNLSFSCF